MNQIIIDKKAEETVMTKMIDKIQYDFYWPCHRFVRDYIFNPVWYRIFGHKHHIVKTGLAPSPWYDTDIRMLYAVMSLVKWHVENDMMEWSKKDKEKEIDRLKKQKDSERVIGLRENFNEQMKAQDGIIEIYKWWKNYSNRQKEIDNALTKWHDYVSGFQKDKHDVIGFLNIMNTLTKKQQQEEKRLLDIHVGLESKLRKEEQHMLKMAVDLRESMWS